MQMNESGTDETECFREVACGRRVAGAIRSPVNVWSLQLECARVLPKSLLMPVLMYASETMIWKEKERSSIRAVQMEILRGLLGLRRIDKVQNAQIREYCRVSKRVRERINEGVLQWFGHVDGIENNRIAKRVYAGDYVGSYIVGMPHKRWFDTVKDCLKKRG